MSIGFRKILRDLWRSKGRTLLAVLSIFIGVFAIGAIGGLGDLMPARMLSSYSATNPAHIVMYLSGGVSDDDLIGLSRLPGVLSVQGEGQPGAQWRTTPDAPWRNASITMRNYAHQQFNTIELLSGEWPANNTVAVDITAVESFGLPTHGTVTMKINDREREVKIGGVVRDLAINAPAWGGNAAFYISQDMAETVFGWGLYSRLRVQLPVFSEQHAEELVGRLKSQLEKIGPSVFFYQIRSPDKHPAQDMVNGVTMILGVMAILSLGLGLFLVVNTINAIVAQQVPQIGVMKAIGGTTRQMVTLYMSGVLFYGLVALLIAVPLAALAANAATGALVQLMAIPPDPVFHVSNQAIVQQLAVGLLVPLLAAMWPIFSGVRITVREAISNYGIGAGFGKGWLDRLLSRLRGLPRPLVLTLRNTFRRKGRVVLTEVTLIMAGVVFVMVMSSAASLTYTINYLIDTLGLKVLIDFQQPYRIDELTSVIRAQSNVDQIEAQSFDSGSAFKNKDTDKGEDIFLSAVRPESALIKLPVVTGRWLLPSDGHAVVLNRDRADKLGVTTGDKVWISLGSSTAKTEWTVVGTVFDLSSMQRTVYVPLSVYQHAVGLVGRSTSVWLSTTPDDGATQLQVEKQLRDTLNARGLRVSSSQTGEQNRRENETKFSILTTMLLAMSALIAAVGAIGLAGTLSINVLERRREIGVMRAIGASSPVIASIFIGEGLLLGLIAWAIAIPLSIPVGQLFATVIGQVIQFDVIYQFSWSGALTWLIIVMVLSILGSVLPAIRATRVSVRESLAYE